MLFPPSLFPCMSKARSHCQVMSPEESHSLERRERSEMFYQETKQMSGFPRNYLWFVYFFNEKVRWSEEDYPGQENQHGLWGSRPHCAVPSRGTPGKVLHPDPASVSSSLKWREGCTCPPTGRSQHNMFRLPHGGHRTQVTMLSRAWFS